MSFIPTWDTAIYGSVASGIALSWYLVDDISVIPSDAIANAGPDKVIATAGDTVLIGDTLDSYVPTYWYANGVIIDSNKSGIYVHPDTTTTYVVGLQLCGAVSYDTVVVRLASDTGHTDSISNVKPLTSQVEPAIWPNPVHNELMVTNGTGDVLYLYDMAGEVVYSATIASGREVEHIASLAAGVYLLQVADPVTGYRVRRMMVKE